MSRLQVKISPNAEQNIAEAYAWYAVEDDRVAAAFREDALDIIDRLSFSAMSYAANERGIRKRRLKRYPYSVHFRIVAKTVFVLAVFHQRRSPPDI